MDQPLDYRRFKRNPYNIGRRVCFPLHCRILHSQFTAHDSRVCGIISGNPFLSASFAAPFLRQFSEHASGDGSDSEIADEAGKWSVHGRVSGCNGSFHGRVFPSSPGLAGERVKVCPDRHSSLSGPFSSGSSKRASGIHAFRELYPSGAGRRGGAAFAHRKNPGCGSHSRCRRFHSTSRCIFAQTAFLPANPSVKAERRRR